MAPLSDDAKQGLILCLLIAALLGAVGSACYALYTGQWRWLAATVVCLLIIRPLFTR